MARLVRFVSLIVVCVTNHIGAVFTICPRKGYLGTERQAASTKTDEPYLNNLLAGASTSIEGNNQ